MIDAIMEWMAFPVNGILLLLGIGLVCHYRGSYKQELKRANGLQETVNQVSWLMDLRKRAYDGGDYSDLTEEEVDVINFFLDPDGTKGAKRKPAYKDAW